MNTSILIQDSGSQGHPGWVAAQLRAGRAQGAVMDPFHSPAEARRGQQTPWQCLPELAAEFPNAELLLDPATHAALLPGTGHWTNYDTWALWPNGRGVLGTPADRRAHVEAVLTVQQELGVPTLAPTVALERPDGADAELALQLAQEARRQDPTVIQALVARRSCWSTGHLLDAHVGQLAALRPQRWIVTAMRDSTDFPPDTTDLAATAGHARTVHSLARRAKVTLGHGADTAAVPALAAGASALGTGWFSKQRVSSPGLYGAPGSGGQYIPWSPHPGLLARLRRDVAEALADADADFALRMRGGRPLPTNEAEYRDQHLAAVRDVLAALDQPGPDPSVRIPAARALLRDADTDWSYAVSLGVAEVTPRDQARWVTNVKDGFELYAQAERL